MSDPEESIKRVLNGLSHIDPEPDLQQRVLRNLAETSGKRASASFTLDLPFGRRTTERKRVFAVTAAVMITLTLAIPHLRLRSGSNIPTRGDVRTESRAAEKLVIKSPHSEVGKAIATLSASAEYRAPGVRRLAHVSAVGPRQKAMAQGQSLAEEEAKAPSKVAPPLPLTSSERLLLRLAQGGRPEEYALLAGQLSARHEVQDRQEFREFFEAPHQQQLN